MYETPFMKGGQSIEQLTVPYEKLWRRLDLYLTFLL